MLNYNGEGPTSYALLKGWSHDISTWTDAQRHEFTNWSNNQPEEAGFGTYNRPRPEPGIEGETFGPGSYRGSYDGVGDTIYWGDQKPLSDVSSNWSQGGQTELTNS